MQETVQVWGHPWRTHIGTCRHELHAEGRNFALDLHFVPQKPVVLHGTEGYSLKGSDPERASCYYSLTPLKAQGTVRVESELHPVTGLAWMVHEYSSEPLELRMQGWDWFSLQLNDGTELMLFGLRQKGGSWHPASS